MSKKLTRPREKEEVKAEANPAHRPRKYKSVEQMAKVIDDYFEICANRYITKVAKDGEIVQVPSPAPRHIQGLCVHLDLSRETLLQYEELPEFSDTVKRAKRKCESYAVDQCFEGRHGNKADFILKNGYGWSDKTTIEQTNITRIIKDDI